MARDVDNIWVGADGRAYFCAAAAAVAPTDATSAVSGVFAELGWISEDGLTEAVSESYNEIKSWDGTVVRKVLTGSERTFKMTFLETNENTLELYYSGDTVEAIAGGSKIDITTPSSVRWAFVVDVVDGDNTVRIYLENAEVTGRGDVVYKNGQAVGYEVTVTAYPDSNGVVGSKFFSDDYSDTAS